MGLGGFGSRGSGVCVQGVAAQGLVQGVALWFWGWVIPWKVPSRSAEVGFRV